MHSKHTTRLRDIKHTPQWYAKREREKRCRAKRYAFINEYKTSRGCSVCGFNAHPAALDFHHTNPTEKSFTIADRVWRAWAGLEEELSKCVILCANCHRIEEANGR